MKLTSKPLGAIVFVILFGGIFFSTAMGWWTTVTQKIPVKFSEGEAAGQYNPADIRGSYTFGDIQKSFGIPAEDLAQAFQIPAGSDAASFPVKTLEELYGDLEQEIGTGSVRLFTAFYTGLPFDLSADTYLLPPGAEILRQHGKMTPEQAAYLETHIVGAGVPPAAETAAPEPAQPPAEPAGDQPAAEATEHVQPEGAITGSTTFQQLLDWGVQKEAIEKVLGEAMPDPASVIKDFVTGKGLEFKTAKDALQAEVDKTK
jgi:hypothetical protein